MKDSFVDDCDQKIYQFGLILQIHHHHQKSYKNKNFVRLTFRQPLQKEKNQQNYFHHQTKNSKHPEKFNTRTRLFRFIEYKNDIAR